MSDMGRALHVPITGSVLEWARREAGLTQASLAAKLKVAPVDVDSWEHELTQPTKTQFHGIINALRRPSALFFADRPPATPSITASFRRASDSGSTVHPDELQPLRAAKRLQAIAEFLATETPELQIPVRLPMADRLTQEPPSRLATDTRSLLAIDFKKQQTFDDTATALKAWRAAVEHELGVFVFQMSFPAEAKRTRGFSLPSPTAPVIVLNTAFIETARIFTLFHECAHLILDDAVVCDVWATRHTKSPNERWAESFAANLLLPSKQFRELVDDVKGNNPHLNVVHVKTIARRTRASVRAAAIRCIDLRIADWNLYDDVVAATKDVDFKPPSKGGGGERTAAKRLRELGPRLPASLFDARDQDLIAHYDVLKFLDMNTDQAKELELTVNARRL